MSALVKELLHDMVKGNLDIDTRVTLTSSIEQLYRSGVFSKQDIMLLEYYLRGFNAEEIAIKYYLSTDTVVRILSRLLIAIEFTSGNLDELFLRKIAAKYNKRQIQQAREYMIKNSKEFTYESI